MNEKHAVEARSVIVRDVTDDQLIMSNGEGQNHEGKVEVKKGIFDTKIKKLTILCISLYWFIICCAYSMIAPFFPGEASMKGVRSNIVGFIFAVFPLAMIVTSPVIGIMIPKVGPKTMLILGLMVESGAQVIFAFLHLMPNKIDFIVYCFLIRIASGLGAAATSTASLTLLTRTFHENLSPAMGILETFGGIGMMAGPPVGGFLYAAGGFKMPFLIIGILAFISIIPLYCFLPADSDEDFSEESGGKMLLLALKVPAITVIALSIAVAGMTLSFLDPTLQHHLQQPFHLSSSQVGLMFLIGPGVYTFIAPLCGVIAEKTDMRIMIIVGAFIVGLSYVLLGPAPVLPSTIFPSSLWLNSVALAILGIGVGPFCVPALSDMNLSAKRYSLPEGIAVQSALSSIFNTMFNIGAIAGPTLGGILVEELNFAWASGIFGFSLFAVGLLLILFTIWERNSASYKLSFMNNGGIDVDSDQFEENAESKPLLS